MSKRHEQASHSKRRARDSSSEVKADSLHGQYVQNEKHASSDECKEKEYMKPNDGDNDNTCPTKKRRLDNPPGQKATVVYYDPSNAAQETALYLMLRTMDHHGRLTRYSKWARKVLTELGPCAADLLWRQVFLGDWVETASKEYDNYRKVVQDWTFDMPNVDPMSSHYNVSPQFTKLVDTLRSCDGDNVAFRGIIYVKRPVTAAMLAEVLRTVADELPSLKPAVIMSTNVLGSSQDESSVMRAFAAGSSNLLITNKRVHNDKLPGAVTFIHFNLTEDASMPLTSCPLGQKTSKLVYMVQRDNAHHRDLIKLLYQAGVTSDPQGPSTLPAEEMLAYPDEDEFIENPTTGARIYTRNAVSSLSRYLDHIKSTGSNDAAHTTSLYTLKGSDNGEDILYLNHPIDTDFPKPLQDLTTRASQGITADACFITCRELFDQGYLDYRFFSSPSPTKSPEVNSNDVKTANMSANTRCYPRKRPSYWTRALHRSWGRFYPLIVTVGAFRDGVHAPMLILSRLPWPEFDAFRVFSNGQKATVRLTPGSPFLFEERKLELLVSYTMRVSRALANKPLECQAEKLLYLFAPLLTSWDTSVVESAARWQLLDIEAHISWAQVEAAADRWATPLIPDEQGVAECHDNDCIIQDRAVEFTNRHFVTRLRQDLTPLSKPDPDTREGKYASYLAFCKEHRKEFQGLRDESQPLIEVSLVPPLVNHLSPNSKTNAGSTKPFTKIFIPELCHKFVIPASTFRTALLLPSITHMIDCMLLVKEMGVLVFTNKIRESDILEAVTPSATQAEHNYQRLELLGDTLLKNIVSLYYFATMPTKREGTLNGARAQAVSNKALHLNALSVGIPSWIQSKPLVPKIWVPYMVEGEKGNVGTRMDIDQAAEGQSGKGPSKSKQQKRQDEVDVQWLGDKTVADVVEALIGAAFHNGGIETVLQVMHILKFKIPEIQRYVDFWRIYEPHMLSYKASLSAKTVKAVSAITGYDFTMPSILAEALTHGSFTVGNNGSSYDRLEFLGDSLLDSHVVWYIFKSHPHLSPGGLSLLKGAMVSNQTLATLAVLTGLYEHVRCSADLQYAIKLYAQKILLLRDQEYQLANAEGRLPTQFWLEVEAPKILGDVVEAIVAAIYLSDQFQSRGVEAFFQKVLKPFYDRHIRVHTLAEHPSKSLFELLQAEGCQQHAMRKQPAKGGTLSEVVVHGVVLARAIDVTTNASMRKAALAALDALSNDPGFVARNCDCRTQKSGKKTQKAQAKQAGYED